MPRVPGQPRQPDMGNRSEVRVRGNAHQLLEKYKQLARDASQAGDRVLAEYYLQHADHYFRTLSEFRARQEQERPRQQNGGNRDDYDDQDDFDAPEPLRVAEMTPVGNAVRAEPQADDSDGDNDEDGDSDGGQQAEPEAIEVPEDRPRRRRRTRSRREDGEAGAEIATVDA